MTGGRPAANAALENYSLESRAVLTYPNAAEGVESDVRLFVRWLLNTDV
jgi:hypothetical protein